MLSGKKNLWELFILHPRAERKSCHKWTAAHSKVSPDSSSAAALRKTLQKEKNQIALAPQKLQAQLELRIVTTEAQQLLHSQPLPRHPK